jgi:hypothetical protein
MKTNLIRIFAAAAIGVIAICASATPASAQAFKGAFTLPNDVRWQGAMLPAGDYTFSLKSGVPAQIIVTRPDRTIAFVLTAVTDRRVTDQHSCLTIERRGSTRFVRELYLADVGLHLRYDAPKIPKNEQELAQGPATTEQVLVASNK